MNSQLDILIKIAQLDNHKPLSNILQDIIDNDKNRFRHIQNLPTFYVWNIIWMCYNHNIKNIVTDIFVNIIDDALHKVMSMSDLWNDRIFWNNVYEKTLEKINKNISAYWRDIQIYGYQYTCETIYTLWVRMALQKPTE